MSSLENTPADLIKLFSNIGTIDVVTMYACGYSDDVTLVVHIRLRFFRRLMAINKSYRSKILFRYTELAKAVVPDDIKLDVNLVL